MRILATLLTLAALTLSVAACNTVHGMGEDISSAGHAITKASN